MRVVYVAGPFTGRTAWEVAENVRRAERIGLEIARAGAMPLIPHANTAHFHGEATPEFWYAGTLELLRRCDAIVLLQGWRGSKGASAEKAEAVRLGLPIFCEMGGNVPGLIPGLSEWLKEGETEDG